jgi:hypothetical protein
VRRKGGTDEMSVGSERVPASLKVDGPGTSEAA